MQICQDIERIYLMQPRPEIIQCGTEDSIQCNEVDYTIKLLIKEATKLKAINAVNFSGNLLSNVKRILREEKLAKMDRPVDIKQKLREIKKFLKKRKQSKAKREIETQDASST